MSDISIGGLKKSFADVDVLKGIDLEIHNGEFIAILGPSGCGKSTLLRLIAGLETASAGSIEIGGRNVTGLEPKDRGCAMVFQNYALYPHMSVADNIGYGLRVARVPKPERRARVEEIARLVELDGLLDRKPAALSGGQRQRVAMARAIIREPSVFLFDEPLSNLDAKLRVQMRHEIRRIHDRVGATSIFVTHDQVEGMTLADRLVIMRSGEIEQIGTPSEIYDQPVSRYVAEFIGAPAMGFLNAQACDGGRAAVLEDGCRVELGGATRDFGAGAELCLGIRPESLAFAVNGSGLSARFMFSEELGNARLHHFDVAGHTIPMVTPDRRTLSTGETVTLALDPATLHIFDPDTERRVG